MEKTEKASCPQMPAVYHFVDFGGRTTWEDYTQQLSDEYMQCIGEGLDVQGLKSEFDAVKGLEAGAQKALAADALFMQLKDLPLRKDFGFIEPNELSDIRAARPQHERALRTPDANALKDKIAGAWYGRIAGCLLGKTVEGIRTEELIPFLKESGNYPMHRYIVTDDLPKVYATRYRYGFAGRCYADKILNAPSDDDTNYTCLYQKLIEKYGRDFTSDNVCDIWQNRQPKTAYCTAERVAYMNMNKGLKPPFTAIFENPYREWIGAQIRADYFGYINPGDPESAAEMAWRDARVSHVKNGIYGEMFVAAMIAWAAVEDDIPAIIRAGLNEIPEKCRLRQVARCLLAKFESGESEEAVFQWIHSLYDEHTGYGWCHTNPNALIVCASMLYKGADYGAAICRAVQTGFDTDCNGATVGSILGMRRGMGCIDKKWTAPLAGTLDTAIIGVGKVSIDSLIETTLQHIEK